MAETETKAERSKRLANSRINKVLKAVRLVEKLASKSYEYTEEEIEKMNLTMSDAVVSCMARFTETDPEAFSL